MMTENPDWEQKMQTHPEIMVTLLMASAARLPSASEMKEEQRVPGIVEMDITLTGKKIKRVSQSSSISVYDYRYDVLSIIK